MGTASESAIFIALARGYFKEVGIAPEFITLDSAARAIPLLGTGDIDIGSGVMSAGLLNAVNRGIDSRIAAPQSEDQNAQHTSP
ncbi:MAG: ABC transporter substrate-binding protein, partial [Chloroflexota bacterium]|nr:ABC transporter substrate-binding protein [Chloroflexota bacterium]